jgi:hypothetical protein
MGVAFYSLTLPQIAPASTLPVLILVIYDWPRDRPNAYQAVLSTSIWGWCVLNFRGSHLSDSTTDL